MYSPWCDSTRPTPANVAQLSPHAGTLVRTASSASAYATRVRDGICVFSASVVAQSRTAAVVGRGCVRAEPGATAASCGTALPGATARCGTSKSGAANGGSGRSPSGRFSPMPTATTPARSAATSRTGPAHRRLRRPPGELGEGMGCVVEGGLGGTATRSRLRIRATGRGRDDGIHPCGRSCLSLIHCR
ncbi:MAG: hypothetical protein ACRDSK_31810 [Actinophytocola sp.]|uniref:hypothetical protein n=1 Tax=Actinophytocola sp. TaxID=1872138 RepID=UPI003D6BCF93